jgi:hypothetical protein
MEDNMKLKSIISKSADGLRQNDPNKAAGILIRAALELSNYIENFPLGDDDRAPLVFDYIDDVHRIAEEMIFEALQILEVPEEEHNSLICGFIQAESEEEIESLLEEASSY